MNKRSPWFFALISMVALLSAAQGCTLPASPGGPKGTVPQVTRSIAFPGTIILGRPTADSVSLSLLAPVDAEIIVEYGTTAGKFDARTAVSTLHAGQPLELSLTGLQKDTGYYYRLDHRAPGETGFSAGTGFSFHTQRAPGSTFSFTLQADSHRDQNVSDDIYKRTLMNARGEEPDFHVDLGDTFMGEKWAKSYQALADRYVEERSFFSLLCDSAPLFLVNGNHEGENGWKLQGSQNSIPVWAAQARKLYYPVPSMGSFYGGTAKEEPAVGTRQSYYAWTWGDALFVVLDPYWYTTAARSPSGWDWTLGREQYDWLKNTLEGSQAKFKFVFIHNLVGGFDMGAAGNGRGGAEAAQLYEWGGLNTDGTTGFDKNRPGWGKPIHQLLVDNHVSIVFHGHDHFFAKQDLDGVVYQECPQPGAMNDRTHAEEYGYVSGVFIGSPGHLRVTVSVDAATVDYIRTYLPDGVSGNKNGEVAYSYNIEARQVGPR
jgi:phosphodiesterase/alkaline phosphatase D-like protein